MTSSVKASKGVAQQDAPLPSFEAFFAATPGALQALRALRTAIEATDLVPALRILVFLRASQVNACAFCVGYHTADGRKAGIADRKLHLLPVWREAPDFDRCERAALGWAEALTLVSTPHSEFDAALAEARNVLGEETTASLTVALGYINAWNRIGRAYRFPIPAF